MNKHQVLVGALVLLLIGLIGVILYTASSVSKVAENVVSSQMASSIATSLEKLVAVEERLTEKGLDGPIEVIGEIIAIHSDGFSSVNAINERSETYYFIRTTVGGRVYELRSKKGFPENLISGTIVRVRGNAKSNIIEIDDATATGDGGDFTIISEAVIATVVDDRSILVIPANFSDKNVQCSETQLDTQFFATDQPSVNTTYAEDTNGVINFYGDTLPVTTISFSSASTDYIGWSLEMNAYAESLGYNPSSYDHISYILPLNGRGSGGLGYLNGTRNWIFVCQYPDIAMHELGHNLGLHHSTTPTYEYGDNSDFMGSIQRVWEDLNAPHKDQKGWVPDVLIKNVTDSNAGLFTLSPLDYPASSVPYPQMLKIPKPDTNEYYYISYRVREGVSESLSDAYRDKINIHTYKGAGTYKTTFIKVLTLGQVFLDSANGLTVTFMSRTADDAIVNIGVTCVPQSPSISVSPTSYSTNIADTKTYEVSVTTQQSSSCGPEEYSLVLSIPGGWVSTKAFPTQTVLSGQTISGSFTVTPPSSVSDGQYTIGVEVVAESITVANASPTYRIDSIAPSVPTNLQGSYKRKKVSLQWNSSTDVGGVSHYNIYRNGILAGTAEQTSYNDSFASSGANVYTVSAVDYAGNESTESVSITVEVTKRGGGGGDDRNVKCTPGAKKKGEC